MQSDATTSRLLADEAVAIVQGYGPDAVMEATADALTYYLARQRATSPASYSAMIDAISALRCAVKEVRNPPPPRTGFVAALIQRSRT